MTVKVKRHTPAKARLASAVLIMALSACSPVERVSTNTVLAHSNCKAAPRGISLVSLAQVASFRGTELITPEHPAVSAGRDLPLFIALSRGPQLTRGFELHLADQAEVQDPTTLKIPVYWTQPDPAKPHPQVSTSPCLVVSVPARQWRTISAVDQHGKSLGTLNLPNVEE